MTLYPGDLLRLQPGNQRAKPLDRISCGKAHEVLFFRSRSLTLRAGKEKIMEGLAVMGFVFGMVGVVALVRLEKLTKTLKEKGILEENYKEE